MLPRAPALKVSGSATESQQFTHFRETARSIESTGAEERGNSSKDGGLMADLELVLGGSRTPLESPEMAVAGHPEAGTVLPAGQELSVLSFCRPSS